MVEPLRRPKRSLLMERIYRLEDLGRAREILGVLVKHGFGQVVSGLPLHRIPGLGRIQDEGHIAENVAAPERAVRAMEELGPAFVKLGQMLSTRPDLLPVEWVHAFARLQDRVPPFPGAQAHEVITQQLGAPVEDLFAEFDDVPVASASIAQVHRAVTHSGKELAIKVQRPGIETQLRSDLNILYVLAGWLEGQIDLGIYTPQAVVEAFDRALTAEADFNLEAASGEALREALSDTDGVAVPKVVRALTSRRVLTMQWAPGRNLSEIEQTTADPQRVLDVLIDATFTQLFVHGLFHGDPHPGNLLVDDDSLLTYLDFGLVGRITPAMRDTMVGLFVSVMFKDADGVARTLYRAGSAEGRVNVRSLSDQVETLLETYGELAFNQQDTGRIALEIMDLARSHGLRLPEEYAVLARAMATLDGIARQLVPEFDIWTSVKPYATRLASERLDPEALGGEFLRSTLSAATLLKDLPSQVDQVLLDLERGNFQLTAATPAVDRLNETIDRLGRALVFGLGVGSFLVSAAILTVGLQFGSEGPLGVGQLASAAAVAFSLLAASGLLWGLIWNLFLAQRVRAVRWGRFVGLIPGLGRKRQDPPPGD
ncbi:MAG: AarF/ABC1/UbiB kinase family protein [Deltaproteobacteria bacterium]|nr:AarF/ABC1/UbiB kinase family protein [Deltaproteobacteria bacterium]